MIVTGLVVAGAGLVTAGAWTMNALLSEPALAATLLASSPLLAGFIFRGFFRGVFFCRGDHGLALVMDLLVAILQLGGLFLLYSGGGLSAPRAVLAVGAAQAVCLPFGLVVLGRAGGISFLKTDLRAALRENWRMGRWLIAKSAAFAASLDSLPWMLKILRNDAASVAALAAGITAVNLSNPFWIGYTNSLGAKMAHVYAQDGAAGLRRLAKRSQVFLLTVMGGLTALLCLFAKPILRLLFGAKYQDQGLVVVVIAVVMLISVGTLIFELVLITRDESRRVFLIYWKVLLFSLIPSVLLIRFWGLTGILISYALAAALLGIFRIRAEGRGRDHE